MLTAPYVVFCLSFKRPKGLARGVESVLSQSYADLECCILDDGSNPPIELPEYLQKDHRLWTIRAPTRSADFKKTMNTPAQLLNMGRQLLSNSVKYVGYSGDAGSHPVKRSEHMIRYLDNNPQVGVLWGHQVKRLGTDSAPTEEIVAPYGPTEEWQGPGFASKLEHSNFIDQPSVIERVAITKKYAFDMSPEAWQDADWRRWKMMASDGVMFHRIPFVSDIRYQYATAVGLMITQGMPFNEIMDKPRE